MGGRGEGLSLLRRPLSVSQRLTQMPTFFSDPSPRRRRHGTNRGLPPDDRDAGRLREALLRSVVLVGFAAGVQVSASAGAVVSEVVRGDLTAADRSRVSAVTSLATEFSRPERYERMTAGAATSLATVNNNAFSHPSANLDFEGKRDFALGNGLFRKVWVAAPASTRASDGLGPLFNARACQRCHVKDGRGHPPRDSEDPATSMVLGLSLAPHRPDGRAGSEPTPPSTRSDPVYGRQLQDFAVPGIHAEGRMRVAYEEFAVELNGGETASLRRPVYSVVDLAYGPMSPEVILSPRVAPPMIGLGLLEAIHPADILAGADPDDANGDGVSGRPSIVSGPGGDQLGRFGWDASAPSVREQSARAFSADIGISNPGAPDPWGDCTQSQAACRKMPAGVQPSLGDTEAPDPVLDLVTFYSANLAVPARREVNDPVVLRGKELFYSAGCTSCHRPKFVTRRDAVRPGASLPAHLAPYRSASP